MSRDSDETYAFQPDPADYNEALRSRPGTLPTSRPRNVVPKS